MERQKLGSEAETRALERERMMLERESADQERTFKAQEMYTRSQESEQRLAFDRERATSEDNFRTQEAAAKAKPEPDPMIAEMDEMNRQAVEQLTALDEKIGQLTEGIVAVVQGQARLEQALSAEKELVRDPKTGKALGVRIKKGNS
jgi:hypothetical protein